MGCWSGVQGRAVAKRRTPVGKWPRSGMSTVVPGAQRAPTPVAARMCGTWKSRLGPDLWSGRLTVRRAGFLGGRRMTEKQKPAAERRRETTTGCQSSSWRWWITGRIPGLVARTRKRLTRSGEPVRRKTA